MSTLRRLFRRPRSESDVAQSRAVGHAFETVSRRDLIRTTLGAGAGAILGLTLLGRHGVTSVEASSNGRRNDHLNDLIVDGLLTTKAGGHGLLVAASTAPARVIAQADYVCDGVNDDVQIQAAIDSAANRGATIYLSRGDFNCSASIIIGEYTAIFGAGTGPTGTRLMFDTVDVDGIVSPYSEAVVRCQGLYLSQLALIGMGQGVSTKSGVLLRSNPSATTSPLNPGSCNFNRVAAAFWDIGIDLNSEADTTLMLDTWGNFSRIGIKGGQSESKLLGGGVYNNTEVGFEFGDTELRGQVQASELEITGNALPNLIIPVGAIGNIVSGNTFSTGSTAVECYGDQNAVTHNIMTNLGATAIIVGKTGGGNDSTDNTIGNNTIQGFADTVAGDGIRVVQGQRNAIVGNTVGNPGASARYGIVLTSSGDGYVANHSSLTGNAVGGSYSGQQIYDESDSNHHAGNKGEVRARSGVATVLNTTTSIAVTHGLTRTPVAGDVSVTPTNNLGTATKFWISAVGATTFTINVDVDPGATTATFAWDCVKRDNSAV